jgi:hypothetical protein
MTAEEVIAVYVGSMRAATVMADLIEQGYTVCGPACGCSCLAARATSTSAGLREALAEWDAIEGSDVAAQFRAFIAAGKMADAIRAALQGADR